jgi:hypothetical protein
VTPLAEFALYVNADGDGGLDALNALAMLAAGVWPDVAGASNGAEPYPRCGSGPIWSDAGVGPDWARLLPLTFAERFLRLPYRFLSTEGGTLRVWLGCGVATNVVRMLRGRVFVNHLLLGNRAVERIEPDAGDAAGDADVELAGRRPVLLEIQDIDTAHHYYDRRYAPIGTDPAQLVALVRRRGGSGPRVHFIGKRVPRRRLRVLYFRALDWTGLAVRPDETVLNLNREPCLQVRTAIHPDPDADAMTPQSRRALLKLFTEPSRPRYPTLPAIARAVRRALPIGLRAWVDDGPTAERPMGMSIALRAMPGSVDRHAYPTWVIGLASRSRAPRQDAARMFPYLAKRVAHRLGGGFGVALEWLPEEVTHG